MPRLPTDPRDADAAITDLRRWEMRRSAAIQ